MSKPQKAPTKLKRGSKRHRNTSSHTNRHTHSHNHGHGHGTRSRPDTSDKSSEVARKAAGRQVVYLSESNQATARPRDQRPARRLTAGRTPAAVAAAAAVAASVGRGMKAGAGTSNGSNAEPAAGAQAQAAGHRRRHARKNVKISLQPPIKEEPAPEPPKVERPMIRPPYNVFMESPRRNGLTPRDPVAEAELAALFAAQRSTIATRPGGTRAKPRRLHDMLIHDDEDMNEEGDAKGIDDDFADLNLGIKPIGAYAHAEQQPCYTCGVCGAKFHIRSLLGAHRRTHDDDFKVRFRGRRPRGSNTTLTSGNLCKFCDRRFDLERTLHIHQMCHCKKIPPQQRRKLGYTELAHEKKAPLPSFTRPHVGQGGLPSNRRDELQMQEDEEEARGMRHPLMQQHEQEMQKTMMTSSVVHERWR